MSFNIFLNQYKKKKGEKKTNTLKIDLEQEFKSYIHEYQEYDLSQVELYNKEREECTSVRLNVNVLPVISNVLTNYKTEIVRFEGSDSAVSLTYENLDSSYFKNETTKMKGLDSWNDIEAVRDTQLSKKGLEFTYHCGMDIFSNYHFRVAPESFKSVCAANTPPMHDGKYVFNTLWDYMREYDGTEVVDVDEYRNRNIGNIHMFTAEEVLDPQTAVDTYFYENNGWFGFDNSCKMKAYNIASEDKSCLEIQNPMCDRNPNDFIDLTPSRDLFTFYPKWNHYRRRLEKNWNYCLTYPYSSTTAVSFIRPNTESLRIASVDEINSSTYVRFTSVSKHNLQLDDYVNIYSGDELIIAKAKVMELGASDDYNQQQYSFGIKGTGDKIGNYAYLDDMDDLIVKGEALAAHPNLTQPYWSGFVATYGGGQYVTMDGKVAYDSDHQSHDNPIPIYNQRWICVDIRDLDLSFKKVEGNSECRYYVRINAKFPNFKYATEDINDYTVQNDSSLAQKYAMYRPDVYDSENGKLAFAKSAYRDQMGGITYTEDISYKHLLDHRGIPVSDVFWTVCKNNDGYKKWYRDHITNEEDIEFSHVFGKLSCAFELSKESELWFDNEGLPMHSTIHTINNIDRGFSGLSILDINSTNRDEDDDYDEVNFDKNYLFYNDLVEYSEYESEERTVQQVQFRFNTAQREARGIENTEDKRFTGITFDTILADDYDGEFEEGEERFEDGDMKYQRNLFGQREGYYYEPHYKIPFRTVSSQKSVGYSHVVGLRRDTSIIRTEDNTLTDEVLIVTTSDNYAEMETKVVFYCSNLKTYFYGIVKGIKNTYSFIAELYDDFQCTSRITGDKLQKLVNRIQHTAAYFRYAKPNSGNPTYADLKKDGSLDFQWREVLNNGFDEADEEVYPLANNTMFIDKKVVFFLRRQWWDRLDKINTERFPHEHSGRSVAVYTFDEFYDNNEIDCLI